VPLIITFILQMMRLPYAYARWNEGDRPIEVTPEDIKYAMSLNEEDGGPVIVTLEDYEYWRDFIRRKRNGRQPSSGT
jgi:hypothetical protein